MSPQARGSAGGRRRHDAASQEDHDKPYVCDSKYSGRHLPAAGPHPALSCSSRGLAGFSSRAQTSGCLLAATSLQSHLTSSGSSPRPGVAAGGRSQPGRPPCPVFLSLQWPPSWLSPGSLSFTVSVSVRFILYFFFCFRELQTKT